VILAYLPNEQHIICATVRHFLMTIRCQALAEIILVYNSAEHLPVERELENLAQADSRLTLLKVREARSKAENLNAVMDVITTPIVGFFDADSQPSADCFDRASDWLVNGYDFVQGSNRIRPRAAFLNLIVAIEYLVKYNVSYVARYRALGVTYFTGSNGYWRTDVVRQLRARVSAQVEDIDMAVRAILAGRRLAYDPGITASEQSPPGLCAWWHQRVRWAQGWAQLLNWHQVEVIRSGLAFGTKCAWTFFLLGRRLLVPVACFVLLPISLLQGIAGAPITACETASFGSLIAIQFVAGWLSVAVLFRSSSFRSSGDPPLAMLLLYAIVFPMYDAVRDLSILRGSVALLRDPVFWRVTPRDIKITEEQSDGK